MPCRDDATLKRNHSVAGSIKCADGPVACVSVPHYLVLLLVVVRLLLPFAVSQSASIGDESVKCGCMSCECVYVFVPVAICEQ